MPHEITGIDASKIDEVQNAFLSTLNSGQKLNIRIEATSHHHEIDGKHVLAFRIPEAQRHEKPIYLGGHPKNSYFRAGRAMCRCKSISRKDLFVMPMTFLGIALPLRTPI